MFAMDGQQPEPQENRPKAGRRAGAGGPAPPVQESSEQDSFAPEASASLQESGQQQQPTASDEDGSDDEKGFMPAAARRQRQPSSEADDDNGDNGERATGGGEREPLRLSPTPPESSQQQDVETPVSAPAPPRLQGRRAATVGGFMGGAATTSEQEAKGGPDSLDESNRQLTGISKRKQEQHAQLAEQKVKAKNKYDERAMDAEILDIPELEEEGKEDLSRVVAEAPKVRTNKVQGIMELDGDMQYMLPAASDMDIDLSMLTAVLASAEQVEEKDDIWTPDSLLVQLASELNSEMEKAEERIKETA